MCLDRKKETNQTENFCLNNTIFLEKQWYKQILKTCARWFVFCFFLNWAWSLQQWKKGTGFFQVAAKVEVYTITLSLSTTTSVKRVKKSDSCPIGEEKTKKKKRICSSVLAWVLYLRGDLLPAPNGSLRHLQVPCRAQKWNKTATAAGRTCIAAYQGTCSALIHHHKQWKRHCPVGELQTVMSQEASLLPSLLKPCRLPQRQVSGTPTASLRYRGEGGQKAAPNAKDVPELSTALLQASGKPRRPP